MVFASPCLHKVRLVWMSGRVDNSGNASPCVGLLCDLQRRRIQRSGTLNTSYCRMGPETAVARGLCV